MQRHESVETSQDVPAHACTIPHLGEFVPSGARRKLSATTANRPGPQQGDKKMKVRNKTKAGALANDRKGVKIKSKVRAGSLGGHGSIPVLGALIGNHNATRI
jgi:hypothetical protein